ncbi:TetR/AcrR family transcriptional regulator [Herbidospora daliensis]|uniref:TetR/AcrR family transcriptional regulator n=1 Tax=Herbidospora daliensis TaxID=295585 RepID=UPI00078203C0|nr:TetR/AcrR family transcriptional regulator [Herbidospora daliensis]
MPPSNPDRRRALTDAAIHLLATSGVHGLTHRTAERAAGLPTGTASNYFRNREALLVAAAERVVELHLADMDAAADRQAGEPDLAELLTESLLGAATVLRDRYLAIFELRLEAVRRPELNRALEGLQAVATVFTTGHHAQLGLAIPPERVPGLIALYGGALFTLVTAPAGTVTRDVVEQIVRAMVPDAPPLRAGGRRAG